MKPVRMCVFAAVVWLSASVSAPPSQAQASAPDSIALAEDSGLHALERADRKARPVTLGGLHGMIGGKTVRVRLGEDAFVIQNARPEPSGLAFTPGDLSGVPAPLPGAEYYMVRWPVRPASPIGWDRIDRIEVRRPSAVRGAAIGLAVTSALVVGLRACDYEGPGFEGFGSGGDIPFTVVGSVYVATGAIVGAGIGALAPTHWKRVAHRASPAAGTGR
jgi:hypothetical protein